MGTHKNKSSGSSNGNKATGNINTSSMPILSGTEKQVAWANSIRINLVDDYNRYINSDDIYLDEATRRTDAADLFGYLYSSGLVDGQKSYPATTKYQEMYNKAVAENPGKKAADIDEITASLYYDKVTNAANEQYRKYMSKYKETKKSGKPDEALKQKAKVERAKVYKCEIKSLIEDSLKKAKKAADWIDTYKFTTYSKK